MLTAVLAITVAVIVTRPLPPPLIAAGTPAGDPVARVLHDQAAALLRADRAGWLAAVDPAGPALRKRYLGVYAALRALRVSHFAYHLGRARSDAGTVDVEIAFCFSGDPCPAPPRIAQTLTLRPAGPGPVITAVAAAEKPTHLQPMPWETGELVVAEGRRVSVGAPPELAGRLREAVRVADRAAAVNDRYAGLAGNPQRRYRVFLAGRKAWRTWYGSGVDEWAAGYMQPLHDVGADVVINVSAVRTPAQLREVVQHELAHVATVSGVDPPDHWLVEGVAEYIGARPGRAAGTHSHGVLRRMTPPTSIVPGPLGRAAPAKRAGEFYALAHYAVECMATTYGERAMMTFVRLRLRAGLERDDAARQAFGRSFAAVDRSCLAWMRRRLGTARQ